MSIFGFSFTEHSDLAEPYKTFVRQMSKWYNGGEMPELASQDLRFALELQRQKLQSLGLDMQCNLKNTGSATGNIYGASYSDRVFTNSICDHVYLCGCISDLKRSRSFVRLLHPRNNERRFL